MNKEGNIYFDYIYETDLIDTILEYGIIKGSNKILFIKPGLDGSVLGKDNKYYRLAQEINKKYGYSVILSNNPTTSIKNTLEDAVRVINDYIKTENMLEVSVYYLGNSNGGVLGARYAYLYPLIKKALLINAPLFISFHKIKDGATNFNGDKMIFVYGSLDPSYKFVEMLDVIDNNKVTYQIENNKDHNMSDDYDLLYNLVESYLL